MDHQGDCHSLSEAHECQNTHGGKVFHNMCDMREGQGVGKACQIHPLDAMKVCLKHTLF